MTDFFVDVRDEDLRVPAKRYSEVRLRKALWDSIRKVELDDLTTDNHFYLYNKGSDEDPEYCLLDQSSLVVALQTLCPTCHIKMLYAITLNLLVTYGVDADLNADGEVSDEDWAALDRAVLSMNFLRGAGGNIPSSQRTRLINLIL